jgi:hypothetical protein
MLGPKSVNREAVIATVRFGDCEADALASLQIERLAQVTAQGVHELNAIGLSAKVANIFGVNPMFLVNASSAGFESAGTCSGFGTSVLGK